MTMAKFYSAMFCFVCTIFNVVPMCYDTSAWGKFSAFAVGICFGMGLVQLLYWFCENVFENPVHDDNDVLDDTTCHTLEYVPRERECPMESCDSNTIPVDDRCPFISPIWDNQCMLKAGHTGMHEVSLGIDNPLSTYVSSTQEGPCVPGEEE